MVVAGWVTRLLASPRLLVMRRRRSAQPLANFQPVQPRHRPVQDCQRGRVRLLQDLERGQAVGGGRHFVVPLEKRRFEDAPANRVVFGNQDAQRDPLRRPWRRLTMVSSFPTAL